MVYNYCKFYSITYINILLLQIPFNSKNLSIGLAALSFLILGPYYGYYLDKKSTSEFIKFGISTKGIVTKTLYSKGERIYYTFKINGKTYTSFNEANLGNFKIGDTIEILYIPYNPNNNTPKINIENKK